MASVGLLVRCRVRLAGRPARPRRLAARAGLLVVVGRAGGQAEAGGRRRQRLVVVLVAVPRVLGQRRGRVGDARVCRIRRCLP
ncbi:hypothetical protein ACWKSP_32200 [Micromonosporaceae bacterium Da 78-11]